MAQFDTFLIGRKTFEAMRQMGSDAESRPGIQNVVFSRTLNPADYPKVTISDDAVRFVTELRGKPGKDLWSDASIIGPLFTAARDYDEAASNLPFPVPK